MKFSPASLSALLLPLLTHVSATAISSTLTTSSTAIPTSLPASANYVYIDESSLNTTAATLVPRQGFNAATVHLFDHNSCDGNLAEVVIDSTLLNQPVTMPFPAEAVELTAFGISGFKVLACFAGFSCFAPSPAVILEVGQCRLKQSDGLNVDKILIISD
ncbi:hypothetical protein EJ04DRAFT_527588 [Polyplosphaeria fusca]|uniref:Uncharacterized protein n=1 Tax=Polyplosphaeria fusca TaxID=682080 RepID=A0A9P4QLU2_9PLEO|nr:hypothetical protein EJ04DRAFT_527588 [Polyplosphaeria fusca]